MQQGFDRRVKWTYATHVVPDAPKTLADAAKSLGYPEGAPRANDIIIAEVVEIGRHTRIEYGDGRKSQLFVGDLLGVVFGHRYATRQWRGRIPNNIESCHLLSVGGVCGEVVDMAPDMEPPTVLRPLGYLLNGQSTRVNLTRFGIRPIVHSADRPTVILVVGSSMDSGKTTAAFSVVNGLTRAGARVYAAKLTGTATMKDPLLMEDAGAAGVLDFTDVGYASTAECSREELKHIATSIITQLSARNTDYLVLEIADGVVQRETEMLLRELHASEYVDYTLYTCNDTLGVREGVRILRDVGMNVIAISGWVACSPLAAQEAQSVSDLPVLQPTDLVDPNIVELFPSARSSGRLISNTKSATCSRAGDRPHRKAAAG